MQYLYADFAKAVYESLVAAGSTEQSFEEWDNENFWSTEPPPSDMTVCERVFVPCAGFEDPFLLEGNDYVKLQLSCTGGAWEIFIGGQFYLDVTQYQTEEDARAAWEVLLKQDVINA
jgi:hypothetical protein